MTEPTTEFFGELPVSHDEGDQFSQRIVESIERRLAYNRGVTSAFDELKVVWVLED